MAGARRKEYLTVQLWPGPESPYGKVTLCLGFVLSILKVVYGGLK